MSVFLLSCNKPKNDETSDTTNEVITLNYQILGVLPHDTKAFTEGLLIYNDKIIESTGHNGQSWVAEVNPTTGKHDKKIILPNAYFGEGITILNNKLYQLTYTTGRGFIYDARTYRKISEFVYSPKIIEGWGLTHDRKHLIVSDGTEKIHFLDTTTFNVVRSITVLQAQKKIKQLNELEFIDNYIFANVWQTSEILKIDPETGYVVGVLDLKKIVDEMAYYPNTDVLNGIAYDKNSRALLVTGKYWPNAYLIRIY